MSVRAPLLGAALEFVHYGVGPLVHRATSRLMTQEAPDLWVRDPLYRANRPAILRPEHELSATLRSIRARSGWCPTRRLCPGPSRLV